jgi:hypothetical protein
MQEGDTDSTHRLVGGLGVHQLADHKYSQIAIAAILFTSQLMPICWQWWYCRLAASTVNKFTMSKLRILESFTLYLRNTWILNLRAIENCVCSIRSIERKVRYILRTV